MAKNKTPQIVKEIQDNPPEPVNFAFEKNVSYSQLSMYTQCPKKWALKYRDGHKVREQSIHMTLVHLNKYENFMMMGLKLFHI